MQVPLFLVSKRDGCMAPSMMQFSWRLHAGSMEN